MTPLNGETGPLTEREAAAVCVFLAEFHGERNDSQVLEPSGYLDDALALLQAIEAAR